MKKYFETFLGVLGIIGFWGGIVLINIGMIIPLLRNTEQLDQHSEWIALIGLLMTVSTTIIFLIYAYYDDKKKTSITKT